MCQDVWAAQSAHNPQKIIRCVRTFVFRGGPEAGKPGCVCPIRLGLEVNDRAIRPWLDSSSGRRTPKNEDITFGHVGIRDGISNDDFGRVWVNCANTRKGDVGGGINHGCEDKVCGEQNQDRVDRPGENRREASSRKGEQKFPGNISVIAGLWRWRRAMVCPVLGGRWG